MIRSAHLNSILASLPQQERDELLREATSRSLPSGEVLIGPGQQYSGVLFPTSGLISVVGSVEDGASVEIAAIGREGMLGLATVFGVRHARASFVVQIPGTGLQVPSDQLARSFESSPSLRGAVLAYAGQVMSELARSATCNRFHPQPQRLARWLAITMRKSGQSSLALTHEFIAQMIGGPRHAVSAELAGLRAIGAIDYQRGHIEILDEKKVLAAACECVHHELTWDSRSAS